MKLLFCPDCGDVVQMRRDFRQCQCGAAKGRYIDDEIVEVYGERTEVLGIDGHSLRAALSMLDASVGHANDISAWMFRRGSDRIRRLGHDRSRERRHEVARREAQRRRW